MLTAAHGWCKDLTDQPLEGVDATWFADRSGFLEGKRRAEEAVVDGNRVIWAQALPECSFPQKAEFVALTKVPDLGKEKRLNIYMDSRYAFATAHIHGAIYQQRGLLTSEGKEI